jgi:hypothetical protein
VKKDAYGAWKVSPPSENWRAPDEPPAGSGRRWSDAVGRLARRALRRQALAG